MNTQQTLPTTPLPQTYFVPRNGSPARVTVRNTDDLRVLRTELELLRRIHRCRLSRSLSDGPGPTRVPAPEASETEEKWELGLILRDAAHPVVGDMIALVDREFDEIRKEIMMSVVNEEAKSIAQDAIDTGALEAAPVAKGQPSGTPDQSVDEALAEAERELAKAVGVELDTVTAADPSVESAAKPDTSADNPTPVPGSEGVEENKSVAACEEDAAIEPASSTVDLPDTNTAVPTPDAQLDAGDADVDVDPGAGIDVTEEDGAAPVPGEVTGAVADTADETAAIAAATEDCADHPIQTAGMDESSTAETAPEVEPGGDEVPGESPSDTGREATPPADFETPPAASEPEIAAASNGKVEGESSSPVFVPGGACAPEQAISQIEQGIRGLADLFRSEVAGQWQSAGEALERIVASRAEADETCRMTHATLSEIARIKEEAEIARDDTNVVRREAKLLREDARRAKERAESSATGAELAADQARRESEAPRNGPAPDHRSP